MQKKKINLHQILTFENPTGSDTPLKILTLPYSNTILFVVTNCDKIGSIVRVERSEDPEEEDANFDVSLAHGYSKNNEIFETFATIFAEALAKTNKFAKLQLFFVSFCFQNVEIGEKTFQQDIVKSLENHAKNYST